MSHRIDCTAQDCGFAVESNDQDELVGVVREHAMERHGMDLTPADAREMMEEV